ncbi:ELL factor, partial [Melanocharis versteri]|nr:ELL factor [Melanocharis versteri]
SPTPFSPCRKYAAISSSEQRQSYKNDFNAEYNEYRDLHARIERITRRFTQLDAKLKQLLQGSEEYKVETGLKPPEKARGARGRAAA